MLDGSQQVTRIQHKAFNACFCKIPSGSELDSYNALSNSYKETHFYKVLGEFDIAVISDQEGFAKEVVFSTPAVSLYQCQNIPATKWNCPYYSSPDSIEKWLEGTSVVGFILLEFDKWLYTEFKLTELISRVIDHYFTESNWNPDNLAFFGGIGQSELIAVIKSDNFKTIFDFINYSRLLKYRDLEKTSQDHNRALSVFSATHSSILISYSEVIKDSNYLNIIGKCHPLIQINCPPGFEHRIKTNAFFSRGKCLSVTGSTDLIINFIDEINSSDLVEQLLSFRSEWSDLSPQLIDTKTTLEFEVSETENSSYYLVSGITNYPDLETEIPGIFSIAPDLSSRVKAITHHIGSALLARSSYPSIRGMWYVPGRLYGELLNYSDAVNTGQDPKYPYEGQVLKLIELAEIGIAQRSETKFSTSKRSHNLPSQFGDGLLTPLLSLETLITFIFTEFLKSQNKLDDFEHWEGFVFFSDVYGFQYHPGDIFSLPLASVCYPLSDEGNWLTLTHELSHAIFTILNIDKVCSDVILEAITRYAGPHTKVLDISDAEKIRDEIYELFANWFDYYHFYAEDHKHYQQSIWHSWATVAFVHKEPIEYVFRSFAIYVIKDIEKYFEFVRNGEEDSHIHSLWTPFIVFLKNEVGKVSIFEKIDMFKDHVLSQALDLLYPFSFLVKKYRLDIFKESLNREYNNLEEHISSIFNGEIINNNINNPYVLLKKCHKKSISDDSKGELIPSISLIYSLRNSTVFYTPEDET